MKKALVHRLSEASGVPASVCGLVLAALAAEIHHGVKTDRAVTVPGIGKFGSVLRAAKMGRNPATGEAVQVPAQWRPTFKPAADLRAAAKSRAVTQGN